MLYSQLVRADLAQRREREARLLTGDAIVAAIAHEVRQPLTAMLAYANAGVRWLDGASPNLEEAKALLKKIDVDGRRAEAVIERVRAMFRKGETNKGTFELNSLVAETVALVHGNLQKHGIMVRYDLGESLPNVLGDRIQLQQVLLNLISNAIDSMAASDEPRVLDVKSSLHEEGRVKVPVADTGAGVAPHDIARIFDPLFTKKSDGMGMGLSICRAIIEAHNGQIGFTQNQPQGANFQFVVPADDAFPADTSPRTTTRQIRG